MDLSRGFEGFDPKGKWDFKQWTNGFGTRAKYPGERIDPQEATQRYQAEYGKARDYVRGLGLPDLTPGREGALTDLTYNAGNSWANAGLGQAAKSGDWGGAKNLFLQYNRAGGQVNQALVQRRTAAAPWFDDASSTPTSSMALGGPASPQSPAPNSPAPPSGSQSMPMPDYAEQAAYQGLTPQQVATRRSMAQSLIKQGTSTEPINGGWLAAIARGLTGGIGGYEASQADQGEAEGLAASRRDLNAKLTAALTGQTSPEQLPTALMSTNNPWSTAPEAGAKMAEPILQAQTQYKMRAAVADQYGLQQGTQAWKRFVLTGAVPSPKDSYMPYSAGGGVANLETGQTIGQGAPFPEVEGGQASPAQQPQQGAPQQPQMPPQGMPPQPPAGPPQGQPIGAPQGALSPQGPSQQQPAFKPGQVIGGVPVGTRYADPTGNHIVEWNGQQWAEPGSAPTGSPPVAQSHAGLPAAGDATGINVAGAPGESQFGPMFSDESKRMANIFAKNPRAAAAIEKTPEYLKRAQYAKDSGAAIQDVEETRRGAQPLLNGIDALEKRFAQVGPKVAQLAIGPNYTPTDQEHTSWLHNTINDVTNLGSGIANGNRAMALGQDSASPSYQAARAQRYGSGNPTNPNDYDKALAANTEMQHFKKGIATMFKAMPGSGKNGATDKAQATLEEMVDAAIHAPDPETFYRITHAAKNFIRNMAQYPSLPEPQNYLPQQWQGAPR